MPSLDSNPLALQWAVLAITTIGEMFLAWRITAKLDNFDQNIQGSLRFVSPLIVGLIAASLWTLFFYRCDLSRHLIIVGLLLVFFDAGLWSRYDHLKDVQTLTVSRKHPDGDYEIIRMVKGSEHTNDAKEKLKLKPGLSDNALLAEFKDNADDVWPRSSRARNRTRLSLYNLGATLGLCSAMVCGAIGFTFFVKDVIAHKPLRVWTKNDCSTLWPKSPCLIGTEISECKKGFTWSTDPPSVGTFVSNNLYMSPDEVKEEQWVRLIASPEHTSDPTPAPIIIKLVPGNAKIPDIIGAPIPGPNPLESRGHIQVLLISAKYSWVCGSDKLLKGGTNGSVLLNEFRNKFVGFTDIISFGAASRELQSGLGEKKALAEEERRAGTRAHNLARWLDGVLDHSKPVFKANLGKYDPELRLPRSKCPMPDIEPDVTAGERRLIIVGVTRSEIWPESELAAQVKEVMRQNESNEPIFKLIVEGYKNNWILERYIPEQ